MLRRVRAALPILATIFMIGFATYLAIGGENPRKYPLGPGLRGGDLVAFWAGGTVIADGDGANLYAPKRLVPILNAIAPRLKPGYPAGYPPPLYQLFALPQPGVSYYASVPYLLLLTVGFQLGVAAVVARTTPALRRPEAIAALIAAPGLFCSLGSGQLGPFWTLALVGGLVPARGAGLALGLLWIKPTLAVPAFLALGILGAWRKAAEMVAGGALVLLVSLAAGGAPEWAGFVEYLGDPKRIRNAFLDHWDREITLRALFVWPFRKSGTELADAAAIGVGWLVLLGTAWRARHVRGTAIATAAVFAVSYGTALHMLDYDAGLLTPAFVATMLWFPRARHPRWGIATTIPAWLLVAFVPLSRHAGPHVPALLLWAWITWLLVELHAAARSAAGVGSASGLR